VTVPSCSAGTTEHVSSICWQSDSWNI